MEKFDFIKTEVEQNNTKFTTITQDIETKRVQAQLCQTEIENIRKKHQLMDLAEQDIKVQRDGLKKNIATMEGLEKAL